MRVCAFDENCGEVPEWPKGTDCKSVGIAFGGSNPPLPIFRFFKLWCDSDVLVVG